MAKNVTQKILSAHLVRGKLNAGEEIGIKIDHTLLQDATGTMAMLEFESLGLDRVQTELSAQYVDHNILQADFKNADDHRYLQTAAARYGIHFSPPGNGISHQVHMERFGVPGKIVIGADSHTPGAAGVSMLGFGAGGLDVAMAMAGRAYYLICPRVLGVHVKGTLPDWVSAKDVILHLLQVFDVKGCLGKVVEYYGPGVMNLSATDRETMGNMGTELGATSTIFPSDERTKAYLEGQGRGDAWIDLSADKGASYDEDYEIDLSSLEPLIACPSSPGNVVPVQQVSGLKVNQVIVGSSTNSSFRDLMVTAKIMEGRRRHDEISFHINPGSRQVLENVAAQGGLLTLIRAGARVHESGCLGCIGMGQAPGTGQVSLRTFPRNFPGRSGTKDDQIYLCSPETAATAALKGVITDPRELSREMDYPRIQDPEPYLVDETSIIAPSEEGYKTEIIRGPNIRPFPKLTPLPETLDTEVVIKVGDNISTDAIMPAQSHVLPLRSNIEAISRFVYDQLDPEFYNKCKEKAPVIVVGGENYGQGSSREHAALAPRFLGVRVKLAKSFARIHKANLCNFGIIPITFQDPADYDRIRMGSRIVLQNIKGRIQGGDREIPLDADGKSMVATLDISDRQRENLLAGGALNRVKMKLKKGS